MFYHCTFFFFFFFQTRMSEVTERIPFILSHNIRSGCNLIMHPKSFEICTPTEKSPQTLLIAYEIFSVRGVRSAQRPQCKLAPLVQIWNPLISRAETIRARRLKFCTHLDRPSALFGNGNFSARGVSGCSAPSVKLGPIKLFFARYVSGRSAFTVNVGDLISYLMLQLES